MTFQAELDGLFAQHWSQRLLFKRRERRIGPGKRLSISHIHQTHGPAGMKLAGCALRVRSSVSECEFLAMAASAGFFPVHRHPLVIKKIPPKLDLRGAHRIIGGNRGAREAFGEIPVEVRSHQAGHRGEPEYQRPKQPALPSATYRSRPKPPASAARSRAARRPGTPLPPADRRFACASRGHTARCGEE